MDAVERLDRDELEQFSQRTVPACVESDGDHLWASEEEVESVRWAACPAPVDQLVQLQAAADAGDCHAQEALDNYADALVERQAAFEHEIDRRPDWASKAAASIDADPNATDDERQFAQVAHWMLDRPVLRHTARPSFVGAIARPLTRARGRRRRRATARRASARSPGSRGPEPPARPLEAAA